MVEQQSVRSGRSVRKWVVMIGALALSTFMLVVGGNALGAPPQGKTLRVAKTVAVAPDATETWHVLFSIGDATLDYACFPFGGGLTFKITVTAGPNGARLANEQGVGGQTLGPNEQGEPFIVAGYTDDELRPFAVSNNQGTAATGIVAAFAESNDGPCVITGQASG